MTAPQSRNRRACGRHDDTERDAGLEHAEFRLPIGGGYESIRGRRPYPGIISAVRLPGEVSRQTIPGRNGLAVQSELLTERRPHAFLDDGSLLNRTGDGREYVVGVGPDEPDGSDDDHQNHCQHDGVFGDVLALLVAP
jgi:hypothetical protein